MSVIDRANASEEVLRIKRAKAFQAFDIYKQNVSYKVINETKEQHDVIVEWYNKALELNKEAIENIPEPIKKYL